MKKIILRFIPFLILMSFCFGAILELSREKAEIERDIVLSLALLESNINSSIGGNLDKMKGLATYIGLHREFDAAETEYFIDELIKNEDNIVSNIGIFEDTTAIFLHPYDENEAMDHINLQELPLFREDALRVKNNFDIIITPPSELVQGGQGIIIRLPILLENSEYWGQIGYMMKFEDVIESFGINNSNLYFKIEQQNDLDKQTYNVFNTGFNEQAIVDSIQFDLPSCIWTISASNGSVFELTSVTFWLLLVFGFVFFLITYYGIKELEFSQFISKGLIESSPDFIVITDRYNNLIDCSAFVTQILEVDKKVILGKKLGGLLSNSSVDGLDLSEIDINLMTEETVFCLTINHEKKYFSLQNRRMTRNRGFVLIGHDIDELKKREIAKDKAIKIAAQTAEVQSNFLANMSHEIRTPMNGIIGMIELSLMEKLEDDVEDYLKVAKKSSHALLLILNDILDYSKLEANKMEITPKPFALESFLKDIKLHFEYVSKEKNIEFILKTNKNIPNQLISDTVRLRQILINLLSNAFKFTKKGSITLSVDFIESVNENVKLQFSVIDTGIGISNENMDNLFQRFNQLDESITRNYGGTGLGLAISKELVELLGGSISCISTEGLGSIFSVTLELQCSPVSKSIKDDSMTQIENINEVRYKSILVVDDDFTNRKFMDTLIRSKGHDVTLAEDGFIAIECCKKKHYDIILMDISMPIIDGFETAIKIKNIEGYKLKETIFIALTAFATKKDKERCFEVGFDDYLSKPVDIDELTQKIED